MSMLRIGAVVAALWCSSVALDAQSEAGGLAASVRQQLDEALASGSPEAAADGLWQAAAAAHGECTQLVEELQARLASDEQPAARRAAPRGDWATCGGDWADAP